LRPKNNPISGIDVGVANRVMSQPWQEPLNELIVRTRKGFVIQTGNSDELVARFPTLELAVRAGIRSFMAVPLISLDNLIGTLVFEAIKPDAYNERDLDLAERIGSQISGAIANGKRRKE
jgi:GAF domain-containing protein